MLGLFMTIAGVFSIAMITPAAVHAQGATTTVTDFNQIANNNAVVGGIAVGGGTDQNRGDDFIGVFKNVINYALGFLGLITLVMLLWAGAQMTFAGGEEGKHKQALTTFKNAAIGLFIIATSWFLVTFIFFVIGIVTN